MGLTCLSGESRTSASHSYAVSEVEHPADLCLGGHACHSDLRPWFQSNSRISNLRDQSDHRILELNPLH